MNCVSLDLTIEGVMADPVIGALMRADRVDRQGFETFLRSAARTLEEARRPPRVPFAALAARFRCEGRGTSPSW